jgi:hypothetical protein
LWLPLKDAAVIWFVAVMPIFSREIVLETPEFSKASIVRRHNTTYSMGSQLVGRDLQLGRDVRASEKVGIGSISNPKIIIIFPRPEETMSTARAL